MANINESQGSVSPFRGWGRIVGYENNTTAHSMVDQPAESQNDACVDEVVSHPSAVYQGQTTGNRRLVNHDDGAVRKLMCAAHQVPALHGTIASAGAYTNFRSCQHYNIPGFQVNNNQPSFWNQFQPDQPPIFQDFFPLDFSSSGDEAFAYDSRNPTSEPSPPLISRVPRPTVSDDFLQEHHQRNQSLSLQKIRPRSVYMAAQMPSDHQAYLADSSYLPPSRASASPPPVAHRRGYQACDACRKRKVKCDLGSVDNPRPPPCLRCKRERRDCKFSETRRKRRGGQGSADEDEPILKRRFTAGDQGTGGTLSPSPNNRDSDWQWPSPPKGQSSHGLGFSGSEKSMRQLKAEDGGHYGYTSAPNGSPRDQQHSMMNQSVASLLHPNISTSHEALHLLSVAAGQSEQVNRQNSQSLSSAFQSPSTAFTSPGSHLTSSRTQSGLTSIGSLGGGPDTAFGGEEAANTDPGLQTAYNAWSRMKFVRAGWISCDEAMAYINYFFEHMAPLTPVVLPDYRNPALHLQVLTEEPILAVAILSIASRHMQLRGSGSTSRDFFVHDRIYQFLSSMLQRLMWAQEQFGGGFTGGGKIRVYESKSGQMAWKGGFRTLGTIEALMLLSDWHPRGLHFPPNEDDNRLLDMDYSTLDEDDAKGNVTENGLPATQSNYSAYIEPAWRCDRMSWTVLGLAQSLAFELGLFDQYDTYGGDDLKKTDILRRRRIRLLLSTYIAAHSGRMGIPSTLPPARWEDSALEDNMATAKLRARHDPVDAVQASWSELLRLICNANDRVFLWKKKRQDLVRSGEYIQFVEQLTPELDKWQADFEKVNVQEPLRTIILLEAYSAHVYVNGLALQAGVEEVTKLTADAPARQSLEASPPARSTSAVSGVGGAPVENLLKVQQGHGKYIRATAEASRKILRLCLEGLIPENRLRHTPARALFRVTTALLFSLKCFIFGATEQDIRDTFDLIGKCVDAMRTQAVDDVHIMSQIAEFASLLTTNIRSAMVRFNMAIGGSTVSSREGTPQRVVEPQQATTSSEQRPTPQTSNARDGQPQFGYNFDQLQGAGDPLAGISSQPLDFAMNLGSSYMPPPNYPLFMTGPDNGSTQDQTLDSGLLGETENLSDWFALPLNNLFNSSNTNVSHGYGGLGPTVGNRDMLELITDDQNNSHWTSQMQYVSGAY